MSQRFQRKHWSLRSLFQVNKEEITDDLMNQFFNGKKIIEAPSNSGK